MKRLFNKTLITYLLMFGSFFIVSLFIYFYTKTLIDPTMYGFNTIKNNLLWVGFSLSWIFLLLFILYLLPEKLRINTYLIMILIVDILLFSQVCYVQQLGKFMVFSDLFLAGEGLQYLKAIFVNMHYGMIIIIVLTIITSVFIKYLNKDNINHKRVYNKKVLISFILIIILLRFISYVSLGHLDESNTWKENYNTKNIYINYTNPNAAMFISGFYEYNIRAVYKYFGNLITLDSKSLQLIIDDYNKIYGSTKQDNEYTGLFKDKNVIFVLMESIDSWVLDKKTMPTLYRLKKEGWNFTNRYSPFFNGGQTINSEFALNTGLYAISDKNTIYDMDLEYPYSLANMLAKEGYSVNSFHANTQTFYNRGTFHHQLGYQYHYSFKDMQDAKLLDENKLYFADSVALKDKNIYKLIKGKDKTLSFITTYSAHLEYTLDNKIFKSIHSRINQNDYSEEEYIYRSLASDTDAGINSLIQNLERDGSIDDTVLVFVSDHYVYGYSDTEYVAVKKNCLKDRKHLQKTPFIIWSKGLKHKNIDTILDTADILPTMFNLLGINYNPNNYMGTDIFSPYHDEFVWFSDGSYIKSNKSTLTNEAILNKANYNIKKNKSILLTDYYGK